MNNKLWVYGLVFLVLAGFCLAQGENLRNAGTTPDSPFYGLDKFGEKVQLAFTFGKLNKAERHLAFAEERLAEMNEMAKKNKTKHVEDLAEDEENEVEEATKDLAAASRDDRGYNDTAEHVANMTYKHILVLQALLDKVPEQARDSILHAINVSQNGYQNALARMGEEKRTRLEEENREGDDQGLGEQNRTRNETKEREEEEENETPENEDDDNETGNMTGKGKLVMRITDAPSSLNITRLDLTITSVRVHTSSGAVEGRECTENPYTEEVCENETEEEEECTEYNVTIEKCENETKVNESCTAEMPCTNGPPTCTTLTMISETATKTAGYTTTNPQATPLDASLYSGEGDWDDSAEIAPTGNWLNPETYADFAGSGADWISSASSTEDGLGDQWRLFKKEFNIPVSATITSADVWFTADNSVAAYLNDNDVGVTGSASEVFGDAPEQAVYPDQHYYLTSQHSSLSPVVGANTLSFVTRNWESAGINPTGLLYKAVVEYCVPCVIPAVCTNNTYVELECEDEVETEENCTELNVTEERCEDETFYNSTCRNVAGGETAGWATVTNQTRTFDLIAIKDVKEVLGQVELGAGKYTQIRLYIANASIYIDGVQKPLRVSSNTLKLIHQFTIGANSTTNLLLDFDAEESVHEAGDRFMLRPTVKITQE